MDIKLGQVVQSLSGRDANNYFVVIEIVEGNMVKIVDGKIRKFLNPKTKKLKHIKPLLASIEIPFDKTKDPDNLNAYIRKELGKLGYSNKEE